MAGDPYLDSDAVFGVKDSLIDTFPKQAPGAAPDGRVMNEPWRRLTYRFGLKQSADQGVLAETPYFSGIAVPDETEAVAIRCVGIIASPGEKGGPGFFEYRDGVMVGTYRHHAGRFTINALHLLQQLGNPAADALLLNLAAEARSHAAPLQPLPPDYAAELTSLGLP